LKARIEVYQEKRPHWEGAGAAKGYSAEHKFLVMNARRHQSDTRSLILVTKSITVNKQQTHGVNMDQNKRTIFGFDLGTNSIGWAVLEEDANGTPLNWLMGPTDYYEP